MTKCLFFALLGKPRCICITSYIQWRCVTSMKWIKVAETEKSYSRIDIWSASSIWIRSWTQASSSWANFFWQNLHSNGFPLVWWNRSWTVLLQLWAKVRSQNWHLYGFSLHLKHGHYVAIQTRIALKGALMSIGWKIKSNKANQTSNPEELFHLIILAYQE